MVPRTTPYMLTDFCVIRLLLSSCKMNLILDRFSKFLISPCQFYWSISDWEHEFSNFWQENLRTKISDTSIFSRSSTSATKIPPCQMSTVRMQPISNEDAFQDLCTKLMDSSFDQLWPIRLWPNRLWPNRLWPILVFIFLFFNPKGGTPKGGPEGWGPEGWGPEGWRPKGWGPELNLEKVGPEGWGPEGWAPAQISRFFFPFPPPFRSFCVSLGVFSWNFGGVSAGALKCARLEFLGCRSGGEALSTPTTHTHNNNNNNNNHHNKQAKTNNWEHFPTPKPTTTTHKKKGLAKIGLAKIGKPLTTNF